MEIDTVSFTKKMLFFWMGVAFGLTLGYFVI